MLDKAFITEPPPTIVLLINRVESTLLDATVFWFHILQGASRHNVLAETLISAPCSPSQSLCVPKVRDAGKERQAVAHSAG